MHSEAQIKQIDVGWLLSSELNPGELFIFAFSDTGLMTRLPTLNVDEKRSPTNAFYKSKLFAQLLKTWCLHCKGSGKKSAVRLIEASLW